MTTVEGRATPEGTAGFRDRAIGKGSAVPAHFRPAPGGLQLSSLGLGSYLGSADGATDLAVEHAVGVVTTSLRANVLDTAINYRHQRAERSIGRALRRQCDSGALSRDGLFVATKVGYLSYDSESAMAPSEYLETELIRPGVLRPSEIVDGSHAMSPRYVEDQVRRSRTNLGLATIDLVYLHNAPDAQLPIVGREGFLERLRLAFGALEQIRAAGGLTNYGLATWESLRCPRSQPEYLAVADAVEAAERAGGPDHGFRFLQFPFNLAMPEAATVRNQPVDGERTTLFEAARRFGLGCFTSVPLLQGQLATQAPAADGLSRAQTALQFARSAPGTIGPLVGLKRPEHLSEALRIAEIDPWPPDRFAEML